MAKKRIIAEFGMGTSLRRIDYTQACVRAVKNTLWQNSISAAELFGFSKDDMLIDVEIGVQQPDQVDVAELEKIFPYGQPTIHVKQGGLDIPKPDGTGRAVVANCAILVSFDMEPTQ